MSDSGAMAFGDDQAQVERMRRRTVLVSGIGGYIDAGSIVAGSVGLVFWTQRFGLTKSMVGLLGAISSNAISAGVGALVGGYLCDRFGRKRVFTKNLLFYMFGVLWLIFVQNAWMLYVGYVLVGFAVGSDVPASWTMMSEAAKTNKRGATGAVMQLLWNFGPVVVLLLGLALQPLGLLGVRLIFGHLFLLALVTYFGRRSITESSRWQQAHGDEDEAAEPAGRSLLAPYRELFARQGVRAIFFCLGLYLFWNLMAGTNGFYQPFLLKTFGHQSNALSVGLQAVYFGLTVVATAIVFIPFSDRVNRRLLFGLSTLLQIAGFAVLAFVPLTAGVALVYIALVGFGIGFGAQAFFQLWSGEIFPTHLRSTAQGVLFSIVRISLGAWSYFVPIVTSTGYKNLAFILMGFLVVSGLTGVLFGPRTQGKTLEEIEREYGWREAEPSAPPVLVPAKAAVEAQS